MKIANVGHIGDAIWTAMMLSKLPGPHTFWVRDEYVTEFRDLLQGMDIAVEPITQRPAGIPEGWIASGALPSWQYPRDCTSDILAFVRRYHNLMASAGRDVLPDEGSMLVDFPALEHECPALEFDILAVNCNPQSGQAPRYSGSEFDGLIAQLVVKGHRVLATNPTSACPWGNYRLSQIGSLSRLARAIIGVASGPLFPTFNIWNQTVSRYVFLDKFVLNYGLNVSIKHFQSAEEMRVQMVEDGLL